MSDNDSDNRSVSSMSTAATSHYSEASRFSSSSTKTERGALKPVQNMGISTFLEVVLSAVCWLCVYEWSSLLNENYYFWWSNAIGTIGFASTMGVLNYGGMKGIEPFHGVASQFASFVGITCLYIASMPLLVNDRCDATITEATQSWLLYGAAALFFISFLTKIDLSIAVNAPAIVVILYFSVCAHNYIGFVLGSAISCMIAGNFARGPLSKILLVAPVDALHIMLTIAVLLFRHAILRAGVNLA